MKTPDYATCAKPKCGGVCHRVDLSRVEEGMGFTGHRCDRCRTLYVVIPGPRGPRVVERPASCDPGK